MPQLGPHVSGTADLTFIGIDSLKLGHAEIRIRGHSGTLLKLQVVERIGRGREDFEPQALLQGQNPNASFGVS